ncbi:putative tetratricopeptide-like helical domain superfamily, DYW domain-containing protein [Dioscorea sansibarensis]
MLAAYTCQPGHLHDALHLFAKIPQPDVISCNTLLSCYLLNNETRAARVLFRAMPVKDVASWNTMISGLCRNGMLDDARKVFDEMPHRNAVSWNAIVSGCVKVGNLRLAEEYFSQAPHKNDLVLQTAMLAGYMGVGEIQLALKMFDEMPLRNSVTWNAVIAGFVENGRSEDGLKLFRRMLAEMEVRPNPSSFSSVLLGCSGLSALELGKQIHQLACKLPISSDLTVCTSLLSMYCKCGDLVDACKLFDRIHRRDVVTWNAMISGYAQHGYGLKAIQLFDKMRNLGKPKPNHITFVAVLTACNHAGLLKLATRYFESMKFDYGLEPHSDHYSCMIDIFCRAGSLVNAIGLIEQMPVNVKPHPAVYGTLLGACRVHRNLEFAEFAANKLVELEPQSAGAYVQLANVYASMNKWTDVSRIRKWMKENNIVKMPGYSWIELKGVVHQFRSGDRLHSQLRLIHAKLDELEEAAKIIGYEHDLDSALHDVGEEQRRMLLWRHSEKLAIAFGLINTPPRKTLRVFKNLRVCGDCHRAMKFIAEIEGRSIVLRDATRFHHFSNGTCSCGDYW